MPWKVNDLVSERMRFVVRLEAGETMTELCREFGISRKTGHKIWNRFRARGAKGLEDESRAPKTILHRTPESIQTVVIAFRKQHPTWGPKKIKVSLEKAHPGVSFPAPSTIGDILKRAGLVGRRARRRGVPRYPDHLVESTESNDVWCADFKGEFRLGNHRYCYPLTLADHFSRLGLACESLESTKGEGVRPVFEGAFHEFGLPRYIRTDNGPPFASKGLAGLSRLSVWWLKLGIIPERIEPGHPEQNGRLERFHLTLKQETTRPPADSFLQQQERFDHFLEEFNEKRPHEALEMRTPKEVYEPSSRKMPDEEPEPEYPLHDDSRRVSLNGEIRLPRSQSIYVSTLLAGESVGLRAIEDGLCLVTFCNLDLGHLDLREKTFKPVETLEFRTGAREEEPQPEA